MGIETNATNVTRPGGTPRPWIGPWAAMLLIGYFRVLLEAGILPAISGLG